MLKTVKPAEEKLLFARNNGILKHYYNYVVSNKRNLLSKLLGVYKVKLKMMQEPIIFVIMDSLIGTEYRRIERLYDLKGSSHKRFTKLTPEQERDGTGLKTLKCQNFNGMDITERDRDETLQILEEDSVFLSQLNLIDYSLLLLKVRDLAPGEEAEPDEAMEIENGVFVLRRQSLNIK